MRRLRRSSAVVLVVLGFAVAVGAGAALAQVGPRVPPTPPATKEKGPYPPNYAPAKSSWTTVEDLPRQDSEGTALVWPGQSFSGPTVVRPSHGSLYVQLPDGVEARFVTVTLNHPGGYLLYVFEDPATGSVLKVHADGKEEGRIVGGDAASTKQHLDGIAASVRTSR